VRTNEAQAKEARLRRWFGLDRTSSADFRCSQSVTLNGLKWHMSDLDAAMGLANLPLALQSVEVHRDNARFYQNALPDRILCPWQEEAPYWIFTVLVEDREGFKRFMADKGIAVSPVHAICTKHPVFPQTPLKGADWFAERNIAIPSGWWIGPAERKFVAEAVKEWCRC
jgi:dTDP-4-amino-4,6-dideoxygalactose transaminase